MRKPFLIAAGIALMSAWLASNVSGQGVAQPYRLSDREVAGLLDRIKAETESFRKSLKDALKQSRYGRLGREDEVNSYVKDLAENTKRLDDHFDHHQSTAADVDSVLDRAGRIDNFMNRYSLTPRVQDDWSTLRADLRQLADAYNISWRWGEGYLPPDPIASEIPYRLSDKEVEEIIHRVEHQSDAFRKSLDKALEKSHFRGSRRKDIDAFVKEFYHETKRLHDHFDHHKSTTSDVETVLDRASQIDGFMRRNRLREQAQNDWSLLRGNLDALARVYNVSWRWEF